MIIKFLGTGSAWPIPRIDCTCKLCKSQDKRDKRKRSSIFIQTERNNILVDVTPDFHWQAIEYEITKIDAVLITHAHQDHIGGLDELHEIYKLNKKQIPLYATKETFKEIESRFPWLFKKELSFIELTGKIGFNDLTVDFLKVEHSTDTIGFIFEYKGKKVVYIPDCSKIRDKDKIHDADIFIIDSTREFGRKSDDLHISIEDAMKLAKELNARETYLTHLGHHHERYEILQKKVFEMGRFYVAYDGLEIKLF